MIIDQINDLHRLHGIDMVLATDVRGQLVLCDIQHKLLPPIFPIAERSVLEMLNDKWRFSRHCQQLGVPIPNTLYFDINAFDVDKIEREIGFPAVMKPINQSGSAGVVQAYSRNQLLAAIEKYRYPCVVIQEYIEGIDIGLSLFARDGEVVCATTFFCGAKTRTEFADIPEFVEYARRVVESTRYSGVANFDARIDRRGDIKVFECNPRFFVRLNYVRLAGIDFLRMGLPGVVGGSASKASGVMLSRGDLRGLMRMFTDRSVARVMLRSWYEYLSDPGPRLMTRLKAFR